MNETPHLSSGSDRPRPDRRGARTRARRRINPLVKAVALAAVVAVAVTGVLVGDVLGGAERAEAVSYLNKWDGVFSQNQLWYKNGSNNAIYAVDNPGSLNAIEATKMTARFDPSGRDHGTPGQISQDTVAVGPVFRHAGDDTIHMVAGRSSGSTYVYQSVVEGGVRKVNGVDYGDITSSRNLTFAPGVDESACRSSSRWSSEVNQRNGYLYQLGAAAAKLLSGNAKSWSLDAAIYKLGEPGTDQDPVTCVAGVRKIDPGDNETLNTQWAAQTGQNYSPANWTLASDMAIDANGNFYALLQGDATHHALVRLEVPHDSAGEPTSKGWTFRLIKAFTADGGTSHKYGLAFTDGALYTLSADASLHRWNPLSGTVEKLGTAPAPAPHDLGAAQAAPVIEGRVFNDRNGDGAVASSDDGISNATVEIYRNLGTESAPKWAKQGSVLTDSLGHYSALLNATKGQFLVRLKQPRVGGVNAAQSYANAESFTYKVNGQTSANTVKPYCATAKGDYQSVDPSQAAKGGAVKCYGARADGIDPPSPADPLAATGGAAIVSRVDMSTDMAVVRADFGVTAAASWGDAPDGYKTTNAAGGPYANPRRAGQPYLHLGAAPGVYQDGDPSPQAGSHPTDDGLEIATTDANGRPTGGWLPAQGQLMASGKKYAFRAQASGDAAAVERAYVKAWITGLSSSGAAQATFSQALLGAGSCTPTPDTQGYVYCDYTAPSGSPAGGVAPVFVRARVSTEAGVTALTREPSNPGASPWMPSGEVEDYGLGVASGVLRIKARTLGSVPAHVGLRLGNVSATWPSSATDSLLTNSADTFIASNRGHALTSRTASVTLTTAGVGAADATQLSGWQLSNRTANGTPTDTWCQDSTTGTSINASVDTSKGVVTIPAPTGGATLPSDITCHLTYAPQADLTKSTVAAKPSDNQTSPLTAGTGTSEVDLKVVGTVRDKDGAEQPNPSIGAEATFTLTAIAGTGAEASGAKFQYSADGGTTWKDAGQSYSCAISSKGGCAADVRIAATSPGGYAMAAKIGTDYVPSKTTGKPTDATPVPVYFKAAAADEAKSFMTVTQTADQAANHDAPGSTAAQWGKQTVTVTLRDSSDGPYQDGANAGELTAAPPAGGKEGVYYGQTTSAGGTAAKLVCAASLVDSRCVDGVYKLEVHASLAGAKRITVTHTPSQGTAFAVREKTSRDPYVVAEFVTPPADAKSSVFTFNGAGETAPQDDLDDPDDDPDGVGVPHPTGYVFHPAIRVWDAGRNNPVDKAKVRFRVDASCGATFAGGTAKEHEVTTSAQGKAETSLRSAAAESCKVYGELYQSGQWVALPGGDSKPWVKTATWQDSNIDPALSHFEVSTTPVTADGKDTGKVTVTLIGTNKLPVTTGASRVSAYGPTGEGVKVSAFTHIGSGVYEASFTGTVSGDKKITVKADGQDVAVVTDGNATAHLVAGEPVASKSWLVQSGGTALADGTAPIALSVRAFDAEGNAATSGEVVFTLPKGLSGNGQAGPGTVKVAVAKGEARIALTSTVATVHKVTASIAGKDVLTVKNAAENTVLANDGNALAAFVAGQPSPADSLLTIPTAGADGKTTKLVGGAQKHRAEVSVEDAKGNAIKDGAAKVVFRYSYTDNSGQRKTGSSQPVATTAAGVAAWEFGSEVATVWTVEARIEGTTADVDGSPATAAFHADVLDQTATLASFAVDQSVKKADAVAYAQAKMKAQDRFGNPIEGVELRFQLDYQGTQGPAWDDATTGGKSESAKSGADGWAYAKAYSLWPGDFDARGGYQAALSQVRQVHFSNVPASAATSRFEVAPKASNSAHPKAVADGKEAYTVTVTLRDVSGTALNAAGATVRMTPRGIVGAAVRDFPVVSGTTGTSKTGQAVIDLTTVKAGRWEVTVLVGQDALGTVADPAVKAVSAEFVPGAASAEHSRLVAPVGTVKADGKERQTVLAQIADNNANAVTGQAVVFAVPSDVQALDADGKWVAGPASVSLTTSAASGHEGAAELVLISKLVGDYSVEAKVGGKDIEQGSPAVAQFVNADLSTAGSEFVVASMPSAKAVGTEFHTPRVTLKDQTGNLYTPSVAVTFYYKAQSASLWTTGPTVQTVKGVALWDKFTVTTAGSYDVRAHVAQGQIPDAQTTRSALFAAGPADATQSVFWASTGQVSPNDKDTHAATVTVKDAYGNLVKGAKVDFELPASDPAHFTTTGCKAKTCELTSSELGLARVEVASPSAVTTHITGGIAKVKVGEEDLVFAAGAPDAAKSSWTITPTGPLTADGARAYTAKVQVRDSSGAAARGGTVDFDLPGAVKPSRDGPYAADSNGLVTVDFTSEVAGKHTVNAKIGSAKIPAADQVIEFAAGDISDAKDRTFLTSPASSAVADAKDTQVVTATVRDAKGNPVTDAEVRFAVPADTKAVGATQGAVDSSGQARLTLTSTKADSYDVTAEARKGSTGSWIAVKGGSPAVAVFKAGAVNLTKSSISKTETGPKVADGAAAYTVLVELKDQHDNPVKVAGTSVTAEFRLHDSKGQAVAGVAAVTRSLTTDADGVATTAFATKTAGQWRATAQIGAGQIVGGSPVPLDFKAGAADPAASALKVTPNNVEADGKARHRATVTAVDANGNPVGGAQVAFAVDQGAPGVTGPSLIATTGGGATGTATTDSDGLAHVDVTSHEPGSFMVSAKIGGKEVKDSPQPVSFDAGAPDPGESSYELTPDTVKSTTAQVIASGKATDAYELTVRVRSAAGILVPNAAVRLTGLDTSKVSIVETGGVSGVTATPASSAYGHHTWHLYSATAAEFSGTVEVRTASGDWKKIEPASFKLRFGSGVASADHSWLIAPVAPVEANGADTATVRAHIVDAKGNDVQAGNVRFTVPAGLTATAAAPVAGGADVTIDAPIRGGYAAVTYTSKAANAYKVTATVGDEAIKLVKDAGEQTDKATDGRVEVVFQPGKAASSNSVLTVTTAAKVADGKEKHRAEVTVKDATGNLVPGTRVVFRYGPDATHMSERTEAADAKGVAAVEFASTEATAYTVEARIAGAEVKDSPAKAEFVAGPFDLTKTLASFEVQDTTAMATGRHPLWARMRAQDAHGNPVKGVTLGFKATAPGDGPVFAPLASGLKTTTGVSPSDGLVTVQLVSEFEGAFPVVGVSGADQTAAKTVTFANDAASAADSWFTVVRSSSNKGDPATADGSDSFKVTVQLRNKDGDPINGLPAVVKVADPASGRDRLHAVTTGRVGTASGVAEFLVKSTAAGAFVVSVEVAGDQLSQPTAGASGKTASVEFVPGPASAATSYLSGPGSGPAKADGKERQVVTVYAKDAHSNAVTTGDAVFTVPAKVTAVGLPSGAKPVTGPATVTVPLGVGGTAELVLVSKVTGTYEVTARVGTAGAMVAVTTGSPASAEFINAAVSASGSKFTIPTGSAVKTVRREFHTPRVELFDVSGNAYTAAPQDVTFRWRLQGAGVWAGEQVARSSGGVALWPSWTVATAGTYEVEAWIASGQVGSMLTARFQADQALPGAARFSSSSGALIANDGKAAHFAEVAVLDAVTGGNPVAKEPVTFTVTGGAQIVGAAGSGRTLTVDSSAAGLSRIAIIDSVVGGEVVTVSATIRGVAVGSASLEFRPGAPDAARSSLEVEPSTAVGAGHPGVVADGKDSWAATVTLRDAGGNLVVDGEVAIVPSAGVSVVGKGPHKTDGSGVVKVTLVTTRAGKHSVRALVGADGIAPDPARIEFVAGPMESDLSYLESPDATAVADGAAELTVGAYVLDAFANPIIGAPVKFSVPKGVDVVGGPSGPAQVEAVTDAAGRAEVALTSTVAAVHEVTAESKPAGATAWAAVEKDSPAVVEFEAGAIDPVKSRISRTPAGPLTVGAAPDGYQVKAELLDKHGNAVNQAGAAVQYRFFRAEPTGSGEDYCRQTPDADTRSASALTDAKGAAAVRFVTSKAGPWHGCAFYAGDRIVGGSPVPLVFAAGDVDQAESKLEVSQNLALADGQATHYAKAWVRDAFGNPLGGQDVAFSIEAGAAKVPGPNVKGGSGTSVKVATCDPEAKSKAPAYCVVAGVFQTGLAYVEFASEEPGTFKVEASLGGLAVTGSPAEVSFTSGVAGREKSAWTITPDTADPVAGDSVKVPATGLVADSYALKVEARSSAGLPVPGVPVRVTGLPKSVLVEGDSFEGRTGDPQSGALGAHTWKLFANAKGTHHGQVQLWNGSAWVNVGASFTVRFAAGAGVAGASWLEGPQAAATADGSAVAEVVARVFDAQGNGADQGRVVFQLPAGVWEAGRKPTTGTSQAEVDLKDGKALLRLNSNVAKTHEVTAALEKAGGDAILTVKDASDGSILRTDGKVGVTFGAGAVSGEDSVLSIPSAANPQPVGGAKHRAEVLAKDGQGNLVGGAKVTFSWVSGTAAGPSATGWTAISPAAKTDSEGKAVYEFAAPGHRAGWVWIKASIDDGSGEKAVGGEQPVPAAKQTVKGARFEPGPVSADKTAASFATYGSAVLANSTDESWARVQVVDQYGNGVPGVSVSFELPASQTGAQGTPVFAGAGTAASSKKLTVTTCAADLADVPDACRVGGVHTPGLARAPVVSQFAGTFPVVGRVADGASGIDLGPEDVVFKAEAGSAAASSFTLEQTDPGAPFVVADAAQSHTLTAAVVNGLAGNAGRPVAGACVAPQLPAGVTVAAPPSEAGSVGGCADGEFLTDAAGTASMRIVSTVAGRFDVGVRLGGSAIPTESGGDVYSRQAVFVGGAPSSMLTELTSPNAPALANDPAGLTVTAALRDSRGNPAACWQEATQVPCAVRFWVPDGARVGTGASAVRGPAWVVAEAGLIDYSGIAAVSGAAGGTAGVASVRYLGASGSYGVTAQLDGEDVRRADGTDWSPDAARAKLTFTDPPNLGELVIEPSDGSTLDGDGAAPGDTITVKGEDGQVLCSTTVADNLSWSCELKPPAKEGDNLTIVEEDPVGESVERPWRVGIPRLRIGQATLLGGERQSVVGENFQPSENVVLVAAGAAASLSAVAGPDGVVRFEWDVPAAALGEQAVALRGHQSGEVTGRFEAVVKELPVAVPPVVGDLVIEPSDGASLDGTGGAAGGTITVKDEDGQVLCSTTVADDLSWSCSLRPPAKEGDTLTIIDEGPSGDRTERPWRVGIPRLTVAEPVLHGGERQSVVGENFQPSEKVVLVAAGVAASLTAVADSDGTVRFEWDVPAGASGKQSVALAGPQSGEVTGEFDAVVRAAPEPVDPVKPDPVRPEPPKASKLPFTGAEGVLAVLGAALGVIGAGGLLVLAAARRRRTDEARGRKAGGVSEA
ncbi:MAG: Ig-like domain-containing protein [Bifidobacteriaceae bacterium]|jgi:hypothetical protein|nr:Ig-like domain-containing protein [Bifidobacteriaceae bacterium]